MFFEIVFVDCIVDLAVSVVGDDTEIVYNLNVSYPINMQL